MFDLTHQAYAHCLTARNWSFTLKMGRLFCLRLI